MAVETTGGSPSKRRAPPGGADNGKPAGKMKPVLDALVAAANGDLSARAPEGLSGEVGRVADLVNSLLQRVSVRIDDAERRKQASSKEIDQAIDGLIALVRNGD